LTKASKNTDRFSKLFHRQTQQEICNITINKDSTTPGGIFIDRFIANCLLSLTVKIGRYLAKL